MDIALVYEYHKVFLEFVWFLFQKKKNRKKNRSIKYMRIPPVIPVKIGKKSILFPNDHFYLHLRDK